MNRISIIMMLVVSLSLIGHAKDGTCRSKMGEAIKSLEAIMSEYKEEKRISFGKEKYVVLYRKAIDIDEYDKLVVLDGNEAILNYGGEQMNYIMLQTTANLLDNKYFLFKEGINDRYEGGALYTASSQVYGINMENLKLEKQLIENEEEFEGAYVSIDVDPTGRYVLLPYIGEDPDFPTVRVFDYKEKTFYEIDSEELIDYQMEKVRWKDSNKVIEFYNPISKNKMQVFIDWETKKIVLEE